MRGERAALWLKHCGAAARMRRPRRSVATVSTLSRKTAAISRFWRKSNTAVKTPEATSTLERLYAIDPLGEIATAMADWRPDRDVSVLFADTIIVPDPVLIEEPALVEARTNVAEAIAPPRGPWVVAPPPAAVAGLDPSIQPFVWDDSPPAAQSAAEPPRMTGTIGAVHRPWRRPRSSGLTQPRRQLMRGR